MQIRSRFYLVFYIALTIIAFGLLTIMWLAGQASVVVEWSTASELDTVGYNLFRSESLEFTPKKINAELVPASNDAFTGSEYQYVDYDVRPGHLYYYWLEDVDSQGNTSRSEPISVRASGGGLLEWALSVVMFLVIGWGWVSLWRSTRRPSKLEVQMP